MRITDKLNQLRHERRKALSIFVTAGFPAFDTTVPLVHGLAEAGADMVELGIPFSDPIADGPTIQLSSETALRNGVTLEKTLQMAKEIRARSSVPLVLMGYANPVFAFGLKKFVDSCADIGVDGMIIADLPLEESEEYRFFATERNVATIFLAAPTTSNERLAELDRCSTGFVYCISITGVTGERKGFEEQTNAFLERARACIKKNSLLVGFGISTPEDARMAAKNADGVIIGSAMIQTLHNGPQDRAIDRAVEFVSKMRSALDDKM